MSWVRMDDRFWSNSKQLRLSDSAYRVWTCSWSYCAEKRPPTGFLTTEEAMGLIRFLGKKRGVIRELVETNAWEELSDGFLIHDLEEYLDEGSRERTRRWRERKRAGSPNTETPDEASPPPSPRDVTSDAGGDATVTTRTRAPARAGYPVPVPVPVETSSLPPYPPEGAGTGSKDPRDETTQSAGDDLVHYCQETIGRSLSTVDREAVQTWSRRFWRLSETEIRDTVRQTVANFHARGQSIKSFAAVLEGPLEKRQVLKVDESNGYRAPSTRPNGPVAIGRILENRSW